VADADRLTRATYLLLAAAGVALVGGVLGFLRKGIIAGVLLLVVAAAPLVFFPKAVMGTAPLILAGLLAFFARGAAQYQPRPVPVRT
jgi:hypothetical protein